MTDVSLEPFNRVQINEFRWIETLGLNGNTCNNFTVSKQTINIE